MVGPESKEEFEDNATKFYARVYGKPLPTVTWYKDSVKQLGEGEGKVDTKELGRKLEVESWLKFEKLGLSDESAHYAVEAENSAGQALMDFSLIG